MDTVNLYAASRSRLLDLAGRLTAEQAERAVAATPGWTVRDLYVHLAGGCADVVGGRMEGAGSEEWTAVQVAERAGRSIAEICEEWAGHGPAMERWLRENRGPFLVFDVTAHERDIGSTVGAARELATEALGELVCASFPVFDKRVVDAGVGSLRVVLEGGEHRLGAAEEDDRSGDEEAATLRTSQYELWRTFFGRRSRAQIVAADWSGDPAPFVDHIHLFDLPERDIVD